MEFQCPKCDKVLKSKRSLQNHLKRKNRCDQPPKSQQVFICSRCQTDFKKVQHLTRHTNRKYPCKKKEDDFHKIIEQMQEQINELQNKESTSVTNITNNNNITQNITQVTNVTINAFGKENLSYITEKFLVEECWGNFAMGDLHLFKIIHCNDDYPENQNIHSGDYSRKIFYITTENGKKVPLKHKQLMKHLSERHINLYEQKCDESYMTKSKDIHIDVLAENDKYLSDIVDDIHIHLKMIEAEKK